MSPSALVDSTNSLKRSRSAHSIAGPAHKKQCSNDRKPRCREEKPALQTPVCNLEKLLRRLAKGVDFATVKALRGLATGRDQGKTMNVMVQSIIERVKDMVAERSHGLDGSKKLLQSELYLEWLYEYEFVLTAVQNVLRSKVQIATGEMLFSILFHLIDEYISAVDAYQDGWSSREPKVPVERCSWVMTLVEEANDSSTDERSEAAVQQAEACLDRFDAVMALAVERFKAECTDHWKHAATIGRKQESLARGCCLLSEQTGYGGADEGGYGLLCATREIMLLWREQSSNPDDSGYET